MLVGYLGQLCWTYKQIRLTNALLEWNSCVCRGLTTLSLRKHVRNHCFTYMCSGKPPHTVEFLPLCMLVFPYWLPRLMSATYNSELRMESAFTPLGHVHRCLIQNSTHEPQRERERERERYPNSPLTSTGV